jgi:hypothetical protein
MIDDRDLNRLLDTWFADGPVQVADRVIDGTANRIARQRQRPAWRLHPWRFPTMSTPIKLVAIGAALLAVLVGGAVFMGGGSARPITAPTAAPTSTPQPSAAAAVTAAPSAGATFAYPSAILPPGSHATASFLPGFTFTLPEPWILDGDSISYYSLFPDSSANRAEWARTGNAGNGILIASDLERPYFVCEAWEDNRGATAAQMVAAVTATEALATTGVVDVEIGGLTGKQFDVRLNPDWTETCPDDPPGFDLGDGRNRVLLLDRPGDNPLVIFVGSVHSADHEAFVAEAMPIVESFQFDLAQ